MKARLFLILAIVLNNLLSAVEPKKSENSQISYEKLISILSKYNNHSKSWSPLNYAIEEQDYDSAIILIEYTADINKVDAGFNALTRLLVKARQNTHKKISNLQIKLIKKLIKHNIDIQWDGYPQNALEMAIFLKDQEIIDLLLKAGAHLNPKWHRYNLMEAVKKQDLGIVNLLLIHGANPNATDNPKLYSLKTALGMAIAMHSSPQEVYEKPGDVPLRKQKMLDIVNLLMQYGAKI